MNKAQVEMLGLAIIVILIISSLMFYMAYKVSHPVRNVKQVFMSKELVTNTLQSMTRVNVDGCPQHELSQLIVDCSNAQMLNNQMKMQCNIKNSCVAANETIIKILDGVFNDSGKKYAFKAKSQITFISMGNCNAELEKIQAQQILTKYPSNEIVELTLDVCDDV